MNEVITSGGAQITSLGQDLPDVDDEEAYSSDRDDLATTGERFPANQIGSANSAEVSTSIHNAARQVRRAGQPDDAEAADLLNSARKLGTTTQRLGRAAQHVSAAKSNARPSSGKLPQLQNTARQRLEQAKSSLAQQRRLHTAARVDDSVTIEPHAGAVKRSNKTQIGRKPQRGDRLQARAVDRQGTPDIEIGGQEASDPASPAAKRGRPRESAMPTEPAAPTRKRGRPPTASTEDKVSEKAQKRQKRDASQEGEQRIHKLWHDAALEATSTIVNNERVTRSRANVAKLPSSAQSDNVHAAGIANNSEARTRKARPSHRASGGETEARHSRENSKEAEEFSWPTVVDAARVQKQQQQQAEASADVTGQQRRSVRLRRGSKQQTGPKFVGPEDVGLASARVTGSKRTIRNSQKAGKRAQPARPPSSEVPIEQNGTVDDAAVSGANADGHPTNAPEVPVNDADYEGGDSQQDEEASDASEDSVDEQSDDTEPVNPRHFYGQALNLQHAFTGIKKVGVWERNGETGNSKPKIGTQGAIDFDQLCKDLIAALDSLERDRDGEEVALLMRRCISKAKHLPDPQPGSVRKLIRDIYAHSIPALTSVLEAYMRSSPATETLAADTLTQALALTRSILRLGRDAVKLRDIRPGNHLDAFVILGPVRNNIIAPLKVVYEKGFRRAYHDLQKRRELQQRQAINAQRRARFEAGERRRKHEEEVIAAWKDRWKRLHQIRRDAEKYGRRGYIEPGKFYHFRERKIEEVARYPDDRNAGSRTEVDANGVPIERVEIFTHRRSLPPGLRAQDDMHARKGWDKPSEQALVFGLEDFAGPKVLDRVIWEYCRIIDGVPGPLRKYNVSEIVACAVWWRDALIKSCREVGEEPEKWMLEIPDPRVVPDTSFVEGDEEEDDRNGNGGHDEVGGGDRNGEGDGDVHGEGDVDMADEVQEEVEEVEESDEDVEEAIDGQ